MSWFFFPTIASLSLISLLGTPCTTMAVSLLSNDFSSGTEGWQIYDYNGGIPGGGNVFYPVTWESSGGVGNSGYVWGDDSRWRIDTPEDPDSILSLIIYNRWVRPSEYLDLRQAHLSVYLRGDQLDLKGASVLFWACNSHQGSRWHYTASPLQVSQGTWGAKLDLVLNNQESLWHNSWCGYPEDPASLNEVLSTTDSFGFSFVGFSSEVTGRFAMDELVITTAPEPSTTGMLATGGLMLLTAAWWHKRRSRRSLGTGEPMGPRSAMNGLRLFLPLMLMTVMGCGGDAAVLPKATVSGVVTYNGKALEAGRVIFLHESGQGAGGDLDSNGGFKLTAFVGKNRVAVKCFAPEAGTSGAKPRPHGLAPARSLIPRRYADFGSSGLTVEVSPDENKVQFALKD